MYPPDWFNCLLNYSLYPKKAANKAVIYNVIVY